MQRSRWRGLRPSVSPSRASTCTQTERPPGSAMRGSWGGAGALQRRGGQTRQRHSSVQSSGRGGEGLLRALSSTLSAGQWPPLWNAQALGTSAQIWTWLSRDLQFPQGALPGRAAARLDSRSPWGGVTGGEAGAGARPPVHTSMPAPAPACSPASPSHPGMKPSSSPRGDPGCHPGAPVQASPPSHMREVSPLLPASSFC